MENVVINKMVDKERPDSIEMPGSTKESGWKIYVNMGDEEDTKRRIEIACRMHKYAEEMRAK